MERYGLILSGRGAPEPEESTDELRASVSGVRECSPRVSASRDQLINIPDENCEPDGGSTRKPICIEPRPPRRKETGSGVANVLQIHLQRGGDGGGGGNAAGGNIGSKYEAIGSSAGKQKIPRPANAFMLFANEWRKKLAIQNPRESNKDISVRLGVLWKNMTKTIKEKYFALAREVDAEHKRKYPDYVYNPKEARLRKAMREQSRELSRQSILQTAIASAAGTGNGSGSGAATSSSFLNHPLQSCGSSAAAVSSMQNNPGVNSGRVINPWFPVGPSSSSTHLKPIISPRIMAAHQRTLEKTKEAMRKQVECAAAAGVFSSGSTGQNIPSGPGYGSEFGNHNQTPNGSNDYCIIAEFGDGQKWHPYQNGGNPYHAGRGGTGMSKVGLHPNASGHGPWVQFCGLPLQSSPAQSPAIRGPRQMVFLQEHQQQQQQQQQQGQHCAFSDEIQMSYVQNKMLQEVNPRLHAGYTGQGDPQAKTSVSPPQMQQLQDEVKSAEVSQGWDSAAGDGNGVVNCGLLQDQAPQQDQEEEVNGSESHEEPRQKPNSKQPLPGFHQAFGSTEIGRFSRSEFFANMVGESGNVSSTVGAPAPTPPPPLQGLQQGGLVQGGQMSQSCQGESKTSCGISRQAPPGGFFNLQHGGGPAIAGASNAGGNLNNFTGNFGNVALAAYYNEVRSPGTPVTNPRWHSPYVGVIGSKI